MQIIFFPLTCSEPGSLAAAAAAVAAAAAAVSCLGGVKCWLAQTFLHLKYWYSVLTPSVFSVFAVCQSIKNIRNLAVILDSKLLTAVYKTCSVRFHLVFMVTTVILINQ